MPTYRFLTVLAAVWMVSCGGRGELCERTFQPYPDLITGRVFTERQSALMHGMVLYSQGEYAAAADSLEVYLRLPETNKAAHLYLANCYLALDRPYDAELQIDHLENSTLKGFEDQCEWYTVVCWLCSGQLDRALAGARRIAEGRRHTYRAEAARLLAELEKTANP